MVALTKNSTTVDGPLQPVPSVYALHCWNPRGIVRSLRNCTCTVPR